MRPPIIFAAKRGDKWDERPEDGEVIRATKGNLRNLQSLGYTDVRVDMTQTMGEGAKPAVIPITALLEAPRA